MGNKTIYKDDFFKLKEEYKGEKNHWDIDENNIFVVQERKWENKSNGHVEMLLLRNSKGKLKKYYSYLFEKVEKEIKKEYSTPEYELNYKIWRETRFDTEENRSAYKVLDKLSEEWKNKLRIKVNSKVKFIDGIERDKYKGRIFRITRFNIKGLFGCYVKLAGLYGTWDYDKLEIVEE
jgi:hypothetical protein